MKRLSILGAVFLALSLAACSSDDDDGGGNGGGFALPAGTVAVNFVVDDTANMAWKAGELEWKGEVDWNPTTRIAVRNPAWLNPAGEWPLLYDDGPWNQGTPPGHEPIGSVAGDHRWSVTIFVTPPAAGQPDLTFGYGLRDATNPDEVNGGWVWIGANGSVTIPAGATGSINAPGLTFPARGNVDMRIVIDSAALVVTDPPYSTATVEVKGSAWGWSEIFAVDDGTNQDETSGDGKYTFLLSTNIDQTVPPYPGLLKTGDKPEWVWVLNGVEYRDPADNSAAAQGVTVQTRVGTGAWTDATIAKKVAPGEPSNGNTYITVP